MLSVDDYFIDDDAQYISDPTTKKHMNAKKHCNVLLRI